MRCKDVTSLMSDYLSDFLSKESRAAIEAHLTICPSCRAELDATRELLSSLASLGGRKVPADLWESVYARVRSEQVARSSWWQWVLRPILAAPAAVVVAVLAAVLLWPSEKPAIDPSLQPEYTYYINSHWRLQRQQAFVDPDVVLVRAELQKSVLIRGAGLQ